MKTRKRMPVRIILLAVVALPLAFLASAPSAHAVVQCVGIGQTPLPSGVGSACPATDPAGNLFDINVCVADSTPADSGPASNPPTVINLSTGPVSAWADFTDPTAPQGVLEVSAAGTTGIGSNQHPC